MKKYILGLSIAALQSHYPAVPIFWKNRLGHNRTWMTTSKVKMNVNSRLQDVISLSFLMTGGRYRNFI